MRRGVGDGAMPSGGGEGGVLEERKGRGRGAGTQKFCHRAHALCRQCRPCVRTATTPKEGTSAHDSAFVQAMVPEQCGSCRVGVGDTAT